MLYSTTKPQMTPVTKVILNYRFIWQTSQYRKLEKKRLAPKYGVLRIYGWKWLKTMT